MYFLSKFCCFCSAKDYILELSDQDSDGITHIHKLTASVVGMDFEALDIMRFICEECCTTLNIVYRFQQNCLRSKRNLATYVSQLQTFSKVSGSVSVCLRDIRQETEAGEQSVMSQTTLINIKQEDSQSTGSDHLNNVRIKKNYELDTAYTECFSIKEENINMDYCNEDHLKKSIVENEHSDIKHETANQNEIGNHFSNLDEDFIESVTDCKEEIDIEEQSVCEVKEEAVSDSETPAESPNQGDRSAAAALDTATVYPVVKRRKLLTDKCLHECLQCEKDFETKLNRYMLKHSKVKPYQCEICKIDFRGTNDLQVHVRTHTGKLSYECNVCKKKFSYTSTLAEHMRTHTGEKPYECDVCKKKFSYSSNIKEHMRLHTGEKPYECDVCKKKFSNSTNMKRHKRIHTGERPYECDVCKLRFTNCTSLKHHRLKLHGQPPHQ